MTWVRLDDRLDEHPKIVAAGPLAFALFVAGLAYCNRNLTDGFIPSAVAGRLCTWAVTDREGNEATIAITAGMAGYDVDSEMVVGQLLEHGLWKAAKGGYRVHDYDQYQPSKQQVEAERKAARERMQKYRSSRGSSELRPKFAGSSEDVREKFADPVPKDLERSSIGALGTTPTTRAAASATPNGATAARPSNEKEPNVPPTKPPYDIVQSLIRNGGWQYEDEALQDEIDKQVRIRSQPVTDEQRTELLELAHQLRSQNGA